MVLITADVIRMEREQPFSEIVLQTLWFDKNFKTVCNVMENYVQSSIINRQVYNTWFANIVWNNTVATEFTKRPVNKLTK